jgi:hypothetical protein
VSVVAPAAAPEPPGRGRWTWQSAPDPAVGCGRDHGRSLGRLDESARRLSHEELAVARELLSEGHHVRSLAERPGRERTPDLLVCDAPVEVKSWFGRDTRGANVPVARSVVNKLLQAEGQAPAVVLYGRGSGLTVAAARAGMADYAGRDRPDSLTAVRVLGDGFDLSWARTRSLQRERPSEPMPERGRHRPRAVRWEGPDLGLGP